MLDIHARMNHAHNTNGCLPYHGDHLVDADRLAACSNEHLIARFPHLAGMGVHLRIHVPANQLFQAWRQPEDHGDIWIGNWP